MSTAGASGRADDSRKRHPQCVPHVQAGGGAVLGEQPHRKAHPGAHHPGAHEPGAQEGAGGGARAAQEHHAAQSDEEAGGPLEGKNIFDE